MKKKLFSFEEVIKPLSSTFDMTMHASSQFTLLISARLYFSIVLRQYAIV